MPDRSKTQLGHFINFSLWKDALDLLNFQIKQKQNNRHYKTLSIFYYEKLNANVGCLNLCIEEYFKLKVASNLFYALEKEFAVFPYVIPKPGLGLRDYKFFTYPMRVVYYSVGLYLVQLSQEFLTETYGKVKNIKAFYGGKLAYKNNRLQVTKNNVYYRSFYEDFQSELKNETNCGERDRVIIKLDVENYFNELSIPKLLELLHSFIKPSTQVSMSYDLFTRDQIICLFQFLVKNKSGIPQSDNNIISSFIGYLYLVFGDLFIDNILRAERNIIDSYKIIRYTDDIYVSLTFRSNISEKERGTFIHSVASQIAEVLYSKLSLKLNLKTRLYRLGEKQEKDELLKSIKKKSPSDEYVNFEEIEVNSKYQKNCSDDVSESPQEKLNKIFQELRKIKKSKIEDYFVRDRTVQGEILQEVFDKRVEQMLGKPENIEAINKIFNDFNFDLVKLQPLEMLVILLKDKTATQKFKEFCLKKTIITTSDADLIVKFLCQTNFLDEKLLLKLKQNTHLKNIVEIFINADLNCDKPGYYNLTCVHMKTLSEMPDVIEQTRLRVLSEKANSYSVALNHLLNEIHAICIKQEEANKKDYNVNDVVKYLHSKYVPHETCIKIRNLFDRRNSNRISHPGSDSSFAWEVTKEEYLDYYEHVGKCLNLIF
jgi:AbiA family abortive infection protein